MHVKVSNKPGSNECGRRQRVQRLHRFRCLSGAWVTCSTGWITHFGEKMANTSAEELTSALAALLSYANGTASVNLYMAHGGSNWGFMAGDCPSFSTGLSMPGIRDCLLALHRSMRCFGAH